MVVASDDAGLQASGPGVLPEMVRLYAASDEDGRAAIAWMLYRLGWQSAEAERALMADIRTTHRDLRIAVQYALGRVSNDDAVVDALIDNMKRLDDKWIFRDKAACSLAYDQIHLTERQKVRLFARLILALEDPDLITRQLAIQVMAVHTGQTKGFDPGASDQLRTEQVETWWRWLDEYRSNL